MKPDAVLAFDAHSAGWLMSFLGGKRTLAVTIASGPSSLPEHIKKGILEANSATLDALAVASERAHYARRKQGETFGPQRIG